VVSVVLGTFPVREWASVRSSIHTRVPTGSGERKRKCGMGVNTLMMITFVKERESKKHNRKQERDKIREINAVRAGYGPAVLSVIKRVLEYVLVAGIVGGGY